MSRSGGTRVALVCALMALAPVAGCKKKKPAGGTGSGSGSGTASAGGSALYTEAELDSFEKPLMARMEENKTRTCPRAVLRGTATPGSADEDILALSEASGELALCATLIKDNADAVKNVMAAPLDAPLPPELSGVATTCAKVEAAFQKAAAHESGCAPYMLGRRREPDGVTALISLTKAAVLRARELARNKEAAAGVRLLLDAARVAQDFGRGAALLQGMVGTATMGIALTNASRIVTSGAAISPADVEALTAELALLRAGEPHVGNMFAAEKDFMIVLGAIPNLHPPDWKEPDNFPSHLMRSDAKEIAPLTLRDFAGVMWETSELGFKPILEACGDKATIESCAKAAPADSGNDEPDLKATLQHMMAGISPTAARAEMVKTMAAIATPALSKYASKYGERSLHMARLNLELAMRSRIASGKPCPKAADFSDPALAALLDVPGAEKKLMVIDRDGVLNLDPAALTWNKVKDATPMPLCPAKK